MLFLLSLMIRAVARLLVLPRTEGATKDLAILVLRHQLRVLRRKTSRSRFTTLDRVLLATASRLLPKDQWASFLVTPHAGRRHRQPRLGLGHPAGTKPHDGPGAAGLGCRTCRSASCCATTTCATT